MCVLRFCRILYHRNFLLTIGINCIYCSYTVCTRRPLKQLYIDNRSGAPIYDQIYSQIKDAILSGQVAEGEALPSIRALAKDLRISVITTKRAYDELESEGFIYTLPGKGCFVAERSTELLREENLKKIEEHMQEIRRLASACRLTENELDEMWRLQREETE